MTERAIFVVRSGFVDSRPWTPKQILGYYGLALQQEGFSTFDLPSVQDLPVATIPEEGDTFKSVTIFDSLNDPPLYEYTMTRDLRDPQPDTALVNYPEIYVTAFSWVLCGPLDKMGFLRDLFRKTHPSTPHIRFFRPSTKFVALYDDAPETLPGYPPKPPLPSACLVAAPEPEPEPEPEPDPEPDIYGEHTAPVPEPEPLVPVVRPEPPPPAPDAAPDASGPRPKPQRKKNVGGLVATVLSLATLGYYYGR